MKAINTNFFIDLLSFGVFAFCHLASVVLGVVFLTDNICLKSEYVFVFVAFYSLCCDNIHPGIILAKM